MNVFPSAVMDPRAQGNSTPKRFRSLSRSPGLPGPRGRRGASRAAGRCRGLHCLVLVRRDLDFERHDPGQTEKARGRRLLLAAPSSGAADSGDIVPARRIAEQIKAVAAAMARRRIV